MLTYNNTPRNKTHIGLPRRRVPSGADGAGLFVVSGAGAEFTPPCDTSSPLHTFLYIFSHLHLRMF